MRKRMTDKIKKLEQLTELHSKVVERLDNTDDMLLEGPLYAGLVDERIRLRTLATGIALDISLIEAEIASVKARKKHAEHTEHIRELRREK